MSRSYPLPAVAYISKGSAVGRRHVPALWLPGRQVGKGDLKHPTEMTQALKCFFGQWGRFLSADPYAGSAGLINPATWSRYAYVIGDPINLNDPTGLEGNPYETCKINGITYPFSCADMVWGFRRPPQQTVWDRALGRLSAALEGIANRSAVSADCQKDLDALSALTGKTIDLFEIQDAVSSTNFVNGTISKLPVSALGGPGFGVYGAAVQAARDAKYGPGQTV